MSLCKKCPYLEFYWSVFFRIRTKRYGVSLRIQFECGKIRTRKTPNTDTILHSEWEQNVLIFKPFSKRRFQNSVKDIS